VSVRRIALLCAGSALLIAPTRGPDTWTWDLPPGFPAPRVPADNPMSAVKVALGRHLFYDVRLSGNRSFSCASCHRQDRAFADALPLAVGSTGERHPRGSMSLANVAYAPVLTWANPNLRSLEQQALIPMFGEHPVELGLSGREDELLRRLRDEPRYRTLFGAAFPGDSAPISLRNITRALGAFQRTLVSGSSPVDRAQHGGRPLSPAARRGERLFFSERLECFHCHGGFTFSGSVDHDGRAFTEVEFHNTGLYNIGPEGRYPAENPGLREFTQRESDDGKFKAPTLRNVAVTAPYMHDGSIATLDGVIDHYAAGGRRIASGPQAGDGSDNPNRSEFINGFTLTPAERRDLLAYLRSLTDSAFLADPRLADPWREGPRATRDANTPADARLHTRLLRSEPARDATVAVAPVEIRLWFSEAVNVAITRVTLEAGTTTIPTGKAARAGGAETPVVVPLTRALAPGRYLVRWMTASADGHPVKGAFRFTLTGGTP
jgi:cytochrome c peroxidase